MSDEGRRHRQSDPTTSRTAEQSTQSASGLSGGKEPGGASEREADDLLNRSSGERYETPRRYEEGDTEPASQDETTSSKI
ncbi:MAG TPA: hypothetical protein VM364_10950 [Vicinamibacterales bacterium]|nr:hypothetical protein [Vicinamibacterales bacterium]